jgi:hypothetical protein
MRWSKKRLVILTAVLCLAAGVAIVAFVLITRPSPEEQAVEPLMSLVATKAGTPEKPRLPDSWSSWERGITIRRHPDAADRYLIRGGFRDDDGPRKIAGTRERAARTAAWESGTPFDESAFDPYKREFETEQYRRSPVMDVDIANGTLTYSSNEVWDRAEVLRPRELERERAPLKPGFRKAMNENDVPRVGGGIIRSLEKTSDRSVSAFGTFGFPDVEGGAELAAVTQAFAGMFGGRQLGGHSFMGTGHLYVQFFDNVTHQRLGEVVRAQWIMPMVDPVNWGYILTPDERYLLIVSDEWTYRPPNVYTPDVYTTKVSVIAVPPVPPLPAPTRRPY